jgi:hypothetical protein
MRSSAAHKWPEIAKSATCKDAPNLARNSCGEGFRELLEVSRTS